MAVDYFLKLDTVNGESVDTNHKNEIQIMSWSWGGSQHSSVSGSGGSGAGKVSLGDFSIMKTFDKASVPFLKGLCAGTHFATGTLTANKAGTGGKPYLKVDFKELFVTSYQVSGSSEVPMESVSFSYNEIKIAYSTQDEKGTATLANQMTFNLKENKLA
jgi:type VI secretion system secreted protein Hcp